MHFWSINFSIIYIAALFSISYFFIRKAVHSYEEYNLCGRSLTFAYIIMTYLGTWVGGGSIIGLVGLSYLSGLSNYWVLSIPYLIGFPFAFLFITRIRKLRQYSIGDMMALRFPKYHEAVRIPTAIAILIRNVTVIGMQFSAISFLVVYVFGIDRKLAILLIFIIITCYTALSGLWGIVATDILQGVMQAAGLILLFLQSLKLSGGWTRASQYFESIDHTEYLYLLDSTNWWSQMGVYVLTIGLFFLIGDQGDWQKLNSCKSDKVAFWGYLTPLCAAMLWLLIPAYVGIFQRVTIPRDVSSELATFQMITQMFSPYLGAFVIVCLLAAVTSSADSFLLASGLTFSRDIVKGFLNPEASDRELIFWNRFFVLIAGGMGFTFAISILNVINLWITGLVLSTSILLIPYLFAWFSRRMNTEGVLSGMAAGGFASLLWLLLGNPFGMHPIWVGIGINLVCSFGVSLVTQKPLLEEVEQTYYWSPNFKGIKNIP